MLQAWQGLTEGQGAVIAALLTMLAAIVGVVLGSLLFGRRVSDLRAAVEETEKSLLQHRDQVFGILKEIGDQIVGLDQQVASTLPKFGALQNALDEQQEEPTPKIGAKPVPTHRIKELWTAIKEDLEQRAADLEIDGRTRAAYARVDRRQYWALIQRLENDGVLGTREAACFNGALELWQRYKSGRTAPDDAAVSQMENFTKQLGLTV